MEVIGEANRYWEHGKGMMEGMGMEDGGEGDVTHPLVRYSSFITLGGAAILAGVFRIDSNEVSYNAVVKVLE